MSTSDNPFEYSKDPELYRIVENLVSLKKRVTSELDKAAKIAGLQEGLQFKELHNVDFSLPNYKSMRSEYSYTKTKMDVIENQVKSAIENAQKLINDTEVKNRPLQEYNQLIISRVTELMNKIGVATSYSTYEYPTSRSRTKKQTYHTAGYVGDLNRTCPKTNVPERKLALENYIFEYHNWMKLEIEKDQKEAIAADEKIIKERILGDPELVAALMLSGVNILNEVQNAVPGKKAVVIQYCLATAKKNILEKDKYLKLGHALDVAVFTLLDSNFEYAQKCVNSFHANNEQDKEMIQFLNEKLLNWDDASRNSLIDDTSKFNVKKIYSMVSDQALIQAHNYLYSRH